MGYRFLTGLFCSFPCQVMVEKMGFPGGLNKESSSVHEDVLGIIQYLVLFLFSIFLVALTFIFWSILVLYSCAM